MYKVQIEKRVIKDLKNIPEKDKIKILDAIQKLSIDPYPRNSKNLKGRPAFRIRIGTYRIIYSVNKDELLILIVKIGHRKDVYK